VRRGQYRIEVRRIRVAAEVRRVGDGRVLQSVRADVGVAVVIRRHAITAKVDSEAAVVTDLVSAHRRGAGEHADAVAAVVDDGVPHGRRRVRAGSDSGTDGDLGAGALDAYTITSVVADRKRRQDHRRCVPHYDAAPGKARQRQARDSCPLRFDNEAVGGPAGLRPVDDEIGDEKDRLSDRRQGRTEDYVM
jgi:hypothetical protein